MSLKAELTLQPNLSEVARLNDWLEAAFARTGLSPSIAVDLKLCLNEIVCLYGPHWYPIGLLPPFWRFQPAPLEKAYQPLPCRP